MTVNPKELCYIGGTRHTWDAHHGLTINTGGVLVIVRSCLRCPRAEEKPYGARTGTWRKHRPDPSSLATELPTGET